jgi:hypothetical protein
VRPALVVLAAGALVAATVAPAAGAPGNPGIGPQTKARAAATGKPAVTSARPEGPNPYLALLPDPAKADYRGWQAHLQSVGEARAAARERAWQRTHPRVAPALLVDEAEPDGVRGSNDTPATAEPVDGFGTADGQTAAARILGSLSRGAESSAVSIRANAEDDGAIPRARRTGVGSSRPGATTTGRIGDGPHGRARSGKGDFDFYRMQGRVGRELVARVTTPTGRLDPMVAVYDAQGKRLALNDDGGSGLDSVLTYRFPADAPYYVMTTGYDALPRDPFRSGSGTGAASQGPYRLRIGTRELDTDTYAVTLREGDVLGVSLDGPPRQVDVLDPSGDVVHGSRRDLTAIFPMASPLPGGGRAVSEHVADEDGVHYVSVSDSPRTGVIRYDATVEAYRPGLEADPDVQTLYLDFDGARVNTGVFGGYGVRDLSPISAFLGRWGLTTAQEDALIDAIVDRVTENVEDDLEARGAADDFAVQIRNSRDHGDLWGQPNVSRVVVGGTIDQSGVPTIGVAQSIDPGDFETEETALVLLDALSGSPEEWEDATLNSYLRPASDRVAFVGQAVGNVVSHEAGHFFGDWHVDQFNEHANLMDQGGNFPVLYGVGPDNIGGTADDPDVDFGEDVFNPNEGFLGIEDTLNRLAVVLVD